MLKVKEYRTMDDFEMDPDRMSYETVAVVNKTNGYVCADVVTTCKSWRTALDRFFKALSNDPRFDGWKDTIEYGVKTWGWKDRETVNGQYTGGWFWLHLIHPHRAPGTGPAGTVPGRHSFAAG